MQDRYATQRTCHSFIVQYATVNSDFASTLASREGLLGINTLTAPLEAGIRALESNVDVLAFGVIDLVPTCVSVAQNPLKTLGKGFENLVSALS